MKISVVFFLLSTAVACASNGPGVQPLGRANITSGDEVVKIFAAEAIQREKSSSNAKPLVLTVILPYDDPDDPDHVPSKRRAKPKSPEERVRENREERREQTRRFMENCKKLVKETHLPYCP